MSTETKTRTDYPSLLQADRIADHVESLISSLDELWLDDWTDVEKTEFGTILIHTQDPDGTVRLFEVAVNEREINVDELDTDEDENSVDPDARRDADQER